VNYFSEEKVMDLVHGAVDRGTGHWSMVHGGPGTIPLWGANLSCSMLIQWLREEEVGSAAATGGIAVGDSLERCFGGQSLTANGLGGGGRDGEPILDGGLVRRGQS
jgi:hypothetical protein